MKNTFKYNKKFIDHCLNELLNETNAKEKHYKIYYHDDSIAIFCEPCIGRIFIGKYTTCNGLKLNTKNDYISALKFLVKEIFTVKDLEKFYETVNMLCREKERLGF